MEHGAGDPISRLVLQLSLILFAAKIGGELAERLFRQPAVLGELAAGVAIGPYALGAVSLPIIGPLFPRLDTTPHGSLAFIPVSAELYAFGQIAAVVLLFVAGLETDFEQFLRFGPAAGLVAAGGVVFPLIFGVFATVAFGLAASPLDSSALFVGAIMTATSVGITARVLGDLGRLDSPEGVTIIGAAVIDDVLGILVLAAAVSLAASGVVSPFEIGLVGGKAFGLWAGLTLLSVLLAGRVSRLYLAFRTDGALVGLALGMAFFSAFMAQSVGLALIIGAYSAGLAFSRSPVSPMLESPLRAVYNALVPIFFVLMGMLVDFGAMLPVLGFGSAITLLAIIGKVAGCAIPALMAGFNQLGAVRVGIGMLPRGEVALIIAGAGLTSGAIGSDIFGVSVMMTIVTTVLAPILLVPAFKRPGTGWRRAERESSAVGTSKGARHVFTLPTELVSLWSKHLEAALAAQGFEKLAEIREPATDPVIEYRRGDHFLSLLIRPEHEHQREVVLDIDCPEWESVMTSAAEEAAREAVTALASSLTPKEGIELRDRLAIGSGPRATRESSPGPPTRGGEAPERM